MEAQPHRRTFLHLSPGPREGLSWACVMGTQGTWCTIIPEAWAAPSSPKATELGHRDASCGAGCSQASLRHTALYSSETFKSRREGKADRHAGLHSLQGRRASLLPEHGSLPAPSPTPSSLRQDLPFPGPVRLPPPPCALDLLHQPGTVLRGPGHTGELPETQPVLRVVMGARPSAPSPRQASAVRGAEPGPLTRPRRRPALRWGPGTPENGAGHCCMPKRSGY